MNQAFVSDPFDTFGSAVGFASVVLVSSLVSQCSLYAFLFHFDHYWFSSFFLYNTTRISFSMWICLVNSSCFGVFSFDWEDSFSSNASCTSSSIINVSGVRVGEHTGAGARVESDGVGGAGPGVESAVSRNTRKISYCEILFF